MTDSTPQAPPDVPIALVTGGAGGIGTECSRALASAGAVVFVAGRREERCAELVDALTAQGCVARTLGLDVTDAASVAAAVERIEAEFGRVDWLINNAGIAISGPLVDTRSKEDMHRHHLEINYHGARAMVEALLPGMRERGYGRIVNVASSAGLRGYAYVSAYCASKHALLGYTRAAAEELAGTGVTIHAICPHYVDSPMLSAAVERVREKTGRSDEEAREFFRAENPSGELVRPEDVASACVELCRTASNGLIVELDGTPFRGLLAQ